jgi:ATP-binding cassette subfamily C protein
MSSSQAVATELRTVPQGGIGTSEVISGGEVVRKTIRSCRNGFILVGAFSVVVNLLMLTTSVYLLQISDHVLVSRSLETLVMITIVALGALVALALFDMLRKWVLTRLGLRMETMLGGPLLAASIERSQGGVSPEVQGLRDLTTVRSFLSGPVVPLLFDLPMAPFYVVVVTLIHWHLGLITLLGGLLLAALALVNQRLTKRSLATASKHSLAALTRAQAQTRNADAVRAMGMMHECVRLWGGENAKALVQQQVASDRNTIVAAVSKFTRLVLQIAILGWGSYLVLLGDITAGMSIAASIIGARALQPIEGAIESWKTAVAARESYERVLRLLEGSSIYASRTLLPEPVGQVSAERLVFVPPGSREMIIKQISFEVPAGTSVALIGPTGAGKSTLAKMIVGAALPASGAVRLDGSDLRNWDPQQLGRSLGYLPQDVELFPGTIAENIGRMRADIRSEDVIAAAKFANVHDLIVNLKQGYETTIFENGAPLSGGQRQRVALARAFFGMPKLVVLDEPDANLDRDGEDALLATMINAKRAGMTVIVTTQRASLLRFVDRILLMRDGMIELYGPRDQVLPKLMNRSASSAPRPEPQPQQPARISEQQQQTPAVPQAKNAAARPALEEQGADQRTQS